jgi:hypothetical protein
VKRVAEHNPFNLEDLVIKPATASNAKVSPKAGSKSTRHPRGSSFIQLTATQAAKLSGASVVVAVFLHLMFRSFRAYRKPFVLPNDALQHVNISRHVQLRALRRLAKLGLISMERESPRKPPVITILGGRGGAN